jgi:SAM-dependent methyltransferase
MNQLADYIEANRLAYDSLVKEYGARMPDYQLRDRFVIAPFVSYLTSTFGRAQVSVLDVGPGSGLNCKMFSDAGLHATGIDVSASMLELARCTAPQASFLHGDYLTHDLGGARFHGIFAKAILHLFTRPHAKAFIQKSYDLLLPNGLLFLSVGVDGSRREGFYPKADYGGGVLRYRVYWTEEDLVDILQSVGLDVVYECSNRESSRGKNWLTILAVRGS